MTSLRNKIENELLGLAEECGVINKDVSESATTIIKLTDKQAKSLKLGVDDE